MLMQGIILTHNINIIIIIIILTHEYQDLKPDLMCRCSSCFAVTYRHCSSCLSSLPLFWTVILTVTADFGGGRQEGGICTSLWLIRIICCFTHSFQAGQQAPAETFPLQLEQHLIKDFPAIRLKKLYRQVSWAQFKELVIWTTKNTGFSKVMYEVRDNYGDRTQMA